MVHIGYLSSDIKYILDNYDIYEETNIKTIEYHHQLFDKSKYPFGWDLTKYEEESYSINNYYFCIDTFFESAFAHWVFESGIYLVLFKKLKELYPSIKIYCKEIKSYKIAFLNAFGFDESLITTHLEKNNKVIFPTYQSFHIFFPKFTDSNDIVLDSKYPYYLNNFYNHLIAPFNKIEKDIDILYLPRGTKENYKGCDRIINIQDNLIEYISNKKNSKVFFTDNITNFNEQLQHIQRSKIIILDYGSNFNVNSFFANNSTILVLGYDIHHEMQLILNLTYNESIKRNNIYFIQSKSHINTSPMIINFDYNEVIQQIEKTYVETLLHSQENLE